MTAQTLDTPLEKQVVMGLSEEAEAVTVNETLTPPAQLYVLKPEAGPKQNVAELVPVRAAENVNEKAAVTPKNFVGFEYVA